MEKIKLLVIEENYYNNNDYDLFEDVLSCDFDAQTIIECIRNYEKYLSNHDLKRKSFTYFIIDKSLYNLSNQEIIGKYYDDYIGMIDVSSFIYLFENDYFNNNLNINDVYNKKEIVERSLLLI